MSYLCPLPRQTGRHNLVFDNQELGAFPLLVELESHVRLHRMARLLLCPQLVYIGPIDKVNE